MLITGVVAEHQPIPEPELTAHVQAALGLESLPGSHARLLNKMIWSAKGRRMIELRDGLWVSGKSAASPIRDLEGRTLDELAHLAREYDADSPGGGDPFEAMLTDLVGEDERAPRIVAAAVGSAIQLARSRGDLPPTRGHAGLDVGGGA